MAEIFSLDNPGVKKPLYFYDTCYLLQHYKHLHEPFCIASVTFQELENIKTSRNKDAETKYRARKVIRHLKNSATDYTVRTVTESTKLLVAKHDLDTNVNDYLICGAALEVKLEFPEDDIIFCTEDINCAMTALYLFNIDTYLGSEEEETMYKGYRIIEGTTEEINKIMSEIDPSTFFTNQYIIIKNSDDGSEKEMRYDGTSFVNLRLPDSTVIKGKNSLQRCALDMLHNKDIPICVILGTYGSGKTFLASKIGIHETIKKGNYSCILGVRSPIGTGQDIGYLPGDFNDKTGDFFLPIAQQLDMGIAEFEKLQQDEVIKTAIPYYLKGQTFDGTFIIADECEDLTAKEIKLIGTRLGEDSKIVFTGDYKQSEIDSTSDNAIVDMCNQLQGNPHFACIVLDEDVRSETSKIFAGLWED